MLVPLMTAQPPPGAAEMLCAKSALPHIRVMNTIRVRPST